MHKINEPTVHIVDDDEEVTASLSWLIESANYRVKTYADVESYLKTSNSNQQGCLILDVRMPGKSGLELQDILNQQGVFMPIIFITGHGDIPMAVRAVGKGALNFLTKPVNNQVLLEIIAKAILKNAKDSLIAKEQADIQARLKQLTPREYEVMELIVAGKLTKSIAHQLGIHHKTVELHRAKVMQKMQVKKIAELVTLVLRHKSILLLSSSHSDN